MLLPQAWKPCSCFLTPIRASLRHIYVACAQGAGGQRASCSLKAVPSLQATHVRVWEASVGVRAGLVCQSSPGSVALLLFLVVGASCTLYLMWTSCWLPWKLLRVRKQHMRTR